MTNLQFQFKQRRISKASVFVNALPSEELANKILCSMLVFLVVSYMAFVSLTIVNVIAQREAGEKSTALRAIVVELEQDYFLLSHDIGESDGAHLGLAPIKGASYVHRPGAVGSLEVARTEL